MSVHPAPSIPLDRVGARGRRRRIVTVGDPDAGVLRSRSRRVRAIDASIRRLAADMLTTMRGARGVGLAAPQVGVPLRVLVAELAGRSLVLVNPRLRRRWGRQVGPEGCLSMPGVYANVRRSLGVVVDGCSARGRRFAVRAVGLLARILQHEIDHLNGVLFTDRLSAGRAARLRSRAPRPVLRRRPSASRRRFAARRRTAGASRGRIAPLVRAAAARRRGGRRR